MIDTHAHLDALEDADGTVARARAAGVTRIVTIGTGIDSCRAALAIAEANDGVYAALGIDPHQAGTEEAERVGRAARAARPPGGRRGRRDRARLSLRRRSTRRAAPALRGPARARRRARATRRDPHARGERRHGVDPAALTTARSSCTASRSPGCWRRGSTAAGTSRSRATSRIRRQPSCGPRPPRCLRTGSWPRPTARTSRRSRSAASTNEPAHVVHTVAALAAARGEDAGELAAQIDANASAAFASAVSVRPRRGSASTSSPTRTSSA